MKSFSRTHPKWEIGLFLMIFFGFCGAINYELNHSLDYQEIVGIPSYSFLSEEIYPDEVMVMDLYSDYKDIFIVDNYTYVLGEKGEIKIYDFYDIRTPLLLASIDTEIDQSAISVDDDYIYVVERMEGLRIYNFTSSYDIISIGNYSHAQEEFYYDVEIDGDYCYLAGKQRLIILDIVSPDSPSLCSVYHNFTQISSILVEDDIVYIADYYQGLKILDVSIKTNPELIKHVDDYDHSVDVALNNEDIFLLNENGGIQTIGVLGDIYTNDTLYNPGFPCKNLIIYGGLGFLSCGIDGILILDIFSTISITEVGYYSSKNSYGKMFLWGQLIFTINECNGFSIIEIGFDQDHDGVQNYKEYVVYNTDMFDADTDGDYIEDGYEIFISGTDPLDVDTDGDTLNDLLEIFLFASDPKSSDSDNDGFNDNFDILPNNKFYPIIYIILSCVLFLLLLLEIKLRIDINKLKVQKEKDKAKKKAIYVFFYKKKYQEIKDVMEINEKYELLVDLIEKMDEVKKNNPEMFTELSGIYNYANRDLKTVENLKKFRNKLKKKKDQINGIDENQENSMDSRISQEDG